jgi:methionyl-tRNA formyltransferase
MSKIGLYAMTAKGVAVLKKLLAEFGPDALGYVVTAHDVATAFDGADEIQKLAAEAGLPVYLRPAMPQELVGAAMAVSWRWLIPATDSLKLVVFHDSLLPKYRGFAPLVAALINGEEEIGVTALLACDEYDKGPVIAQESTVISYPITIDRAITAILPCYEKLAVQAGRVMLSGVYDTSMQDEAAATYSLWRDEDDYLFDWRWDASKIRRFVDAVGYPYRGALTFVGSDKVRLLECEEVPDVTIENRDPGKVIFVHGGEPVVVCGRGLLKIKRLTHDSTQKSVLPLRKFRTRFRSVG